MDWLWRGLYFNFNFRKIAFGRVFLTLLLKFSLFSFFNSFTFVLSNIFSISSGISTPHFSASSRILRIIDSRRLLPNNGSRNLASQLLLRLPASPSIYLTLLKEINWHDHFYNSQAFGQAAAYKSPQWNFEWHWCTWKPVTVQSWRMQRKAAYTCEKANEATK